MKAHGLSGRLISILTFTLALFLCWQICTPSAAFALEKEQTVKGNMTITLADDTTDVSTDVIDNATTNIGDSDDDIGVTLVANKPTATSTSASGASLVTTGDSLLWLCLGFGVLASGFAYIALKSRSFAYAKGSRTSKKHAVARNKMIAVAFLAIVAAAACFGVYGQKVSAVADDTQADLATSTSSVVVDADGKVKSGTLNVKNACQKELTIKAVSAPSTFENWSTEAVGKQIAIEKSHDNTWAGDAIPADVLAELKATSDGKLTKEYDVTVTYYENDMAVTDEDGKVVLPDNSQDGEEVTIVISKKDPSGENVPVDGVTVEIDKDGNVNVIFPEGTDTSDDEIITEVKDKNDDPIPGKEITVRDDTGVRGPTKTNDEGTTSNPGYNGTPDETGATNTTDAQTGKEIVTTVTYVDDNGQTVTVTDYTVKTDKETGNITVTVNDTNAIGKDVTVNVSEKGGDGVPGKEITMVDAENKTHGPKTTDSEGDAFFPGFEGETDTNGKAEVRDPILDKEITVVVTYVDENGVTKKVPEATVIVDKTTGEITVKLPEDFPENFQKIVVNVTDSDGNVVKNRDVEVTNSDGTSSYGTKKTDEKGDATFPGNIGTTDGTGATNVVQPGTTNEFKTTVTYVDENGETQKVKDAVVVVDAEGKFTVDLPSNVPPDVYEKIVVNVKSVTTDESGTVTETPVQGKEVTLNGSDGNKIDTKNTNDDGDAIFPGNKATTGEDGTAPVVKPSTADQFTVTVTYVDKDGNTHEVKDAIVIIDKDGNVSVQLPEGFPEEYQKVIVNVKDSNGDDVTGTNVTLKDPDGDKIATKKTDGEGDAIFYGNTGVTESDGEGKVETTVFDKTTGKELVVKVETVDGTDITKIEGATVVVDENGKISVKMPDGTDYSEDVIKVTVTEKDPTTEATNPANKQVTVTDDDGTRGPKWTDPQTGEAEFAPYKDTTEGSAGDATITDGSTGKEYVTTVTVVPAGGGDPIVVTGAVVTIDEDGKVNVTLPETMPTEYYEKIVVNVEEVTTNKDGSTTKTPADKDVILKANDETVIDEEHTNADGDAIFPGNYGKTGTDATTEVILDKKVVNVEVSYEDENGDSHKESGAIVKVKPDGTLDVTLPENSEGTGKKVTVTVTETDGTTTTPVNGVEVTLNDDESVRGPKTTGATDNDGKAIFPGPTVETTKEDGTTDPQLNPFNNKEMVTTVTYAPTEGAEATEPVAGAKVAIDADTGKVTVTLPTGEEINQNDVKVNIKYVDGTTVTYEEVNVTVKDSYGTRGPKNTSMEDADKGDAFFPGHKHTAETDGTVTITDPTTGKELITKVEVWNEETGAYEVVPNAEVSVDEDGKVSVKMPDGTYSDKEIKVTVTEKDGVTGTTSASNKEVSVTDEGGSRGPKWTDPQTGEAVFPPYTGTTETGEDLTLTDPSDGSEYVTTVTYVPEGGGEPVVVTNATVTYDEDGNVNVQLPESVGDTWEKVNVNVEKVITSRDGTTTKEPAISKPVVLKDKDGDVIGNKKTDEDGDATFFGTTVTTDDKGKGEAQDSGDVKKELIVTVTYDDGTETPAAVDGATISTDNNGDITVVIPAEHDAIGKDITVKVVERTYSTDGTVTEAPAVRNVTVQEISPSGYRGPKTTDATKGEAFFPGYSDTATDKGEATITNPTDGKELVTKVEYKDPTTGQMTPLDGAEVTIDTDGNITVQVPENSPANEQDIKVTVSEKAQDGTLTPVPRIPVTVKDKVDGEDATRGPIETSEEEADKGEAYFPGYSGKTGTEGATDEVTNPSDGTTIITTVTYYDKDGNGPTVVKDAVVTIDTEGNITVKLPEGFPDEFQKVIVNVADSEGNNLPGKEITLKNNEGTKLGEETTGEDGNATFIGNTTTTTEEGTGEVVKPKSDEYYKATVTYIPAGETTETVVTDAKVTVDADGKFTVVLPEDFPATYEEIKVNIKDETNTNVAEKSVTVKTNGGDAIGTKSTGTDGNVIFKMYTVTFDTDEGTAIADVKVAEGGKVTQPADGATTKAGYKVAGWYEDDALQTEFAFATKTINKNTTIYVKWTGITYKVAFDGNGNTEGTVPDTVTVTYGDTSVTYPDNTGGLKNDDKTFAGWNTAADGKGTHYAPGAAIENLTDEEGKTITLYAEWSEIVVTFDLRGKGDNFTTSNVTKGGYVTEPSNVSAAGYTLNGWYTDETFQTKWTFASDVVNESMTLYANWGPEKDAETSQPTYWIAPASMYVAEGQDVAAVTNAYDAETNPDGTYFGEEVNITKSRDQIQADVAVLSAGESDDNPTYADVLAEYTGFMNSDKYHLYTKVSINTDAEAYMEFRIINVGQHFAIGDSSDGSTLQGDASALTFQAIHSYILISAMYSSSGGNWSTSDLRSTLNEGGLYYSYFNSTLRQDIMSVKKFSRESSTSGATRISTKDKMWVASLSEMMSNTITDANYEGERYTFWNADSRGTASATKTFNKMDLKRTWANWSPRNYSGFWTRTPYTGYDDSYCYATSSGGYSSTGASSKMTIVPCFCFGSAKTVTFDLQNKGTNFDSAVNSGKAVTKPANPKADGYVFKGWYEEATCENAWDFDTAVTGDMTLYAKWEPAKYTVEFNNNGDSVQGSVDSIEATFDDTSKVFPTGDALSWTDWSFKGWNSQPDGKGTHYDEGATIENLATKDGATVTVYAEWEWAGKTYTVWFDENDDDHDGSGPYPSGLQIKYGYTQAVFPDKADFARDGYVFNGWNTDWAPEDGTHYDVGDAMPNTAVDWDGGSVTYYAEWITNVVEFDYRGHAPNVIKQIDTETGKVTAPTPDPEVSGLKIEGWYRTSDCTGEKFDFDEYVSGSAFTLYANWVPDESAELIYWIAPSMRTITFGSNGSSQSNSSYVNPEWNILRSREEIQADVKVLDEGEGNANYAATKARYDEWMKNDNFHLYTKIGTGTAVDDYAEFRIVNVGALTAIGDSTDVTKTKSNGTVLTFQATHALPTAYCIKDDYEANGWSDSTLRGQMQSGGEIYNLFKTGFTTDICMVSNYTRRDNSGADTGDEIVKTQDKFWLASLSQMVPDATRVASEQRNFEYEGSQFAFWAARNISGDGYSNYALTGLYETRNSNTPKNGSSAAFLRTPGTSKYYYYLIKRNGYFDSYEYSKYQKLGIDLCFSFGFASKKVTFDLQEKGDDWTVDVESGSTVDEPTTEPTTTGYNFGGWYKDKDCKVEWDFENDVVKADTRIYAKWIPWTYTVHFDGNEATAGTAPEDIEATYDSVDKKFPGKGSLVNGDKKFKGWNTEKDGTGVTYAEGDVIANLAGDGETFTVYADWADEITITWDSTDGHFGTDNDDTYRYTTKLQRDTLTAADFPTEDPVPILETDKYKTLVSWNTHKDGTGITVTKDNTKDLVLNGDMTFYAQWKSVAEYYWIAPALADDPEDKVLKTWKEIDDDVALIRAGNAAKIAEWQALMYDDEYHLYVRWDTKQEKVGRSTEYFEFNIVNVGPHKYNEAGDTDGSALTFIGAHMSAICYQMNLTSTNIGGWPASNLRTLMQKDETSGTDNPNDTFYNRFETEFTDKIFKVKKASNTNWESLTIKETEDSFWVPSRNEICGDDSESDLKDYDFFPNYPKEGYEYDRTNTLSDAWEAYLAAYPKARYESPVTANGSRYSHSGCQAWSRTIWLWEGGVQYYNHVGRDEHWAKMDGYNAYTVSEPSISGNYEEMRVVPGFCF